MAAAPAWFTLVQDKEDGWSTDAWKGGLFHVDNTFSKKQKYKHSFTFAFKIKKKILNSVRIHVHCCNLDYFTSPNEKQESKHCVTHQTRRQQYSHLFERPSKMNATIQASRFKVGSRGRSQVRRALCGFQDPKVLISVPSVTTQDSALPLGRAARL